MWVAYNALNGPDIFQIYLSKLLSYFSYEEKFVLKIFIANIQPKHISSIVKNIGIIMSNDLITI